MRIKKILHTTTNPTKYRADVIHYVDIDDIENVTNCDTKNVTNNNTLDSKNATNYNTPNDKNTTNYDIEEIV